MIQIAGHATIAAERNDRPGVSLRQLPYRSGVIYGPIQSRRVGWSLGVNLLGQGRRICTYDCSYCQFPRPAQSVSLNSETSTLLRVPEILTHIEHGIRDRMDAGLHFDSVSFVGNGDPSVHPDLLEIALFTRALLARVKSTATLTIFTNALPYRNKSFIDALSVFDRRLIKLDAGDDATFHAINHPRVQVDLDSLVAAVAQLDGVVIQTMVVAGVTDNRASICLPRFANLVIAANATEVQLATIDKKPASTDVTPVTETELNEIAARIQERITIPVVVYYQDCPSGFPDATPPSRQVNQQTAKT